MALREVPGGYDLDRLPISVPIDPDESTAGWLMRAAGRYGLNPRQLLLHLDVESRASSLTRTMTKIAGSSGSIAHAFGITPDALTKALDGSSTRIALTSYLRNYHGQQLPQLQGSRYCPDCLSDRAPRWSRQWSSPLDLICERHKIVLLTTCPRCGQVPWSDITWTAKQTDGSLCPQRRIPSGSSRRRRRVMPFCGHDLSRGERMEVSTEAVAAQRTLRQLAEAVDDSPNRQIEWCGVWATATIVFDAYCELIDEAVGVDALLELDTSFAASEMIAALVVAERILASESFDEATARADEARLLSPTGRHTPVGSQVLIDSRPHNPLLAAIRLTALAPHFSPATQLTFRCGLPLPRYPSDTAKSLDWQQLPAHRPDMPEVEPGWIPQLLWAEAAECPGMDELVAIAAKTMAMAKIGQTRSWRMIAYDLGLPADLAKSVARWWKPRFDDGEWSSMLDELVELSEQLRSNPPPINYQHRRVIADDFRLVVRAIRMGRSAHPKTQVPLPILVRRFWEVFTGGDIRLAARPYQTRSVEDWHSYRRAVGNAGDAMTPVFQSALDELRFTFKLPVTGPLTWSPP